MTPTGMIIGGKRVACSLPVYNWNDHGMELRAGDGYNRSAPTRAPDLFVWHWWGFEGPIESLFRALKRRSLGSEFGICNGKIYQFCDPLIVDAAQAGKYNRRSAGCEVRNYGFTTRNKPPPAGGADRKLYECVQQGRKRVFAEFYPEDLACMLALAKSISEAIPSIPAQIPVGADGKVYSKTISSQRMASVKGHVGHYHISAQKSDPGPQPLQAMLDRRICAPFSL